MRRRTFTLFTPGIDINTLRVIEGSIRPRALDLVLEWARLHQQELREAWAAATRNHPPRKIAPLE